MKSLSLWTSACDLSARSSSPALPDTAEASEMSHTGAPRLCDDQAFDVKCRL